MCLPGIIDFINSKVLISFLSSAARSGAIFNHDVRVAEHHVSSFLHHSQEVCGLEWAPNGKLLASGGNDNILNIWDIASTETSSAQRPYEVITPMHSLCEHMAAVKVTERCVGYQFVVVFVLAVPCICERYLCLPSPDCVGKKASGGNLFDLTVTKFF